VGRREPRFGAIRFGAIRFGAIRFGAIRFGAIRFGAIGCRAVQSGGRTGRSFGPGTTGSRHFENTSSQISGTSGSVPAQPALARSVMQDSAASALYLHSLLRTG
jgi:hypothetical protein